MKLYTFLYMFIQICTSWRGQWTTQPDGIGWEVGGREGVHAAERGFRIADFAKGTPAHQRAGTVPWFLRKHPHLDVLPKKLAHFFNNYMPGAFRSLNWLPSDGSHKELKKEDILALQGRLERMPTQDVHNTAEIVVFSFLKIGSTGRKGCQHVCCYPFTTYHSYHRQVYNCIKSNSNV